MSYGVESYGIGSYGDPAEQAGGPVTHTATAALTADSATVAAVASRAGASVTHTATVDLTASAAVIAATASRTAPSTYTYRAVLTGDSNHSGRGSFNQTNSATDSKLFNNSGTVVTLTDPYDAGPNTYAVLDDGTSAAGSYVQHFADLLQAAGKSALFIPANKGGTQSSNWTSTTPGSHYDALKSRINDAGGDGADLIIFIALGANDANSSVSQTTFKANIETLVGNLNSDFPLAKKYLQKVHHFTSAPAGAVDAIRAGAEDVYAGSSGCLRGADLEGVTNDIHYGATGVPATCTAELNEVALRTYNALMAVTHTATASLVAGAAVLAAEASRSHLHTATAVLVSDSASVHATARRFVAGQGGNGMVKVGGSYLTPVAVYVKKAGAYTPSTVFVKTSGVYTNPL